MYGLIGKSTAKPGERDALQTIARRRLGWSAAMLLSLACDRPRAEAPSSAATAQGVAPWCTDSLEVKAIACAGSSVRRSGDTLLVRLDTGRDTAIVNQRGTVDFDYQYVGRIGRTAFHLVERIGGERSPLFIVMSPHSGRSTDAQGMPVPSPDRERFAAANAEWDCAKAPDQSLEVWRLTDSLPVREWRIDPLHCEGNGTTTGWAAMHPRWRGADTLVFTRYQEETRGSQSGSSTIRHRLTPAAAVRDPDGWRVLDPRR